MGSGRSVWPDPPGAAAITVSGPQAAETGGEADILPALELCPRLGPGVLVHEQPGIPAEKPCRVGLLRSPCSVSAHVFLGSGLKEAVRIVGSTGKRPQPSLDNAASSPLTRSPRHPPKPPVEHPLLLGDQPLDALR